MAKVKKSRVIEYSPELAYEICDLIARGESILNISKREGMPSNTTFYKWMREIEEFKALVETAKEDQADTLFEEMIKIADDGSEDHVLDLEGNIIFVKENVQRSRLKVDTRKWVVSRLQPKKYGERASLDVNANVTINNVADNLTKARERRKQLEDKGNESS